MESRRFVACSEALYAHRVTFTGATFLPFCENCGHEVPVDEEFCQNCGTARKEIPKPESKIAATRTIRRELGRLKSLRALLLIAIIVGASMLGASFVFQPRSTSPEYLASLRDQFNQLNGQLSALQQQADNLRSQVNALQAEISASQSRVSTLQGEIQQLQTQLTSVRSEIASLRQQLGDVQNQLTSTRSSLNVAQQQLDQIRNNLQEATNKVQQLESALQQQKATMQNYVANRDQAQSRHDSLLAQYNPRAATYNTRASTYDQKKQDYDSRMSAWWNRVLVGGLACIVLCLGPEDVPCIIPCLSILGIPELVNEYNALQQLKSWLQTEHNWLQSEYQQLQALKGQIDQASRDVAHWNDMIQTQQATINKTQNDLDYWRSQKNQLTNQLSETQNRVNQLTTQVKDLESKQAQLQSSLDSDLAKEQQLESSAISKEVEVNRLQDLIQSRSKEKSTAEATLRKCEADIQKTKDQVDVLGVEINLVVVHPYLRWGGLAIFAVGVAALIVTTVGVATLISGMRAGIVRVRRLRRTGPVPGIGTPIETAGAVVEVPVQGAEETPAKMAGEAPTEVPAKPAPEIAVVQGPPTLPKIVKPRKGRRPAAAKPRRKESAGRKMRTGKKAEGRS